MIKQIIISIHDISPKYETEFKIIFKRLNELKIEKKEGLVVLNWRNKFDLEKNKIFEQLILNYFKKEELSFHGLTHYSNKKSFINKLIFGKEYSYVEEFKNKSEIELKNYLKKGIFKFEKIFKIKPKNIIQSRWKNSKKLEKISKELNFNFLEDSTYIINLKNNNKKFSIPICFDFGNNIILNKSYKYYVYILIYIAKLTKSTLRFSIHPNDINNGNFDFEINLLKKLLDSGYIPIYKNELFELKL